MYYSVPKESQQNRFGETLSVKIAAMQLLLLEIDAIALFDFNDVLSSTSDQELAPVHSCAWHTDRKAAGQSELRFRPFSISPIPEPTSNSTMPRTKNSTTAQRQRIIAGILQLASDGVLAKGAHRAVAAANGIHPSTVSRLWSRAKAEAELTGLYTKDISVTKASYRQMLVTRVLPAICAHWPDNGESIVVQQDNVPARIPQSDAGLLEASTRCGRNVELRCQPPNSPDLNVLDLGLFTAIQARQRLKNPRIIDELIESITESYWELPPETINSAFLRLQDAMVQCIIQRGNNDFKPRHGKNAQLEREGRPPLSIRCSDEAAEYVIIPSVL
ncbi:unnamed protein product [Phytophthora fragariaefolia]|uniref:Unnamed protein product n=1 Tax=Phytophthora fragariaefolia TaxID=1490495 RepID=A0A9W6Y856_9STRA|nr:unnamed protein product [Phytophthora fragariaefolia]